MAESLRILVADDDATARLLMRAALEKAGYQVVLASDGEAALRQFRAAPCDMVMLDVEMPGLTGFEVCAALRREMGDDLPIVMVTGMDDVHSIERAYDSGATDFIAKPINWNLIGHRILYLSRAYRTRLDLKLANARNAAIFDAIPDTLFRLSNASVVLDCRGAPEAGGHLLPRVGLTLAASFPPEVTSAYQEAIRRARDAGGVQSIDYMLHRADGRVRHYESRITFIDANETLCLVRDITERKEAESRMQQLAYFDSLTGLPNRVSFLDRLDREIRRAQREESRLAVLFLDLDGFKGINDTLGHNVGDMVLQWSAERLRHAIRPGDLLSRQDEVLLDLEVELARLGGDEFTVLIPNISKPEDALVIAHRIRELMHRPFVLDGQEVVLTTSIGIAIYPDDGNAAATLLKYADTAMYHAKEEGRDNCQFYSASLTERAQRRFTMGSNLRLALERDEFSLLYQPQLDLATGTINSVEALIRWQHPEQGIASPMEFIPLAEENGLIIPIGEWVLRTACARAANWWRAGHGLRVAVNLSPLQFRNQNLVQSILAILKDTGLPPHLLELEVTEGALMEDSGATMATLTSLRNRGINIALDDFGTGYSSLSYLSRLPLTSIKVDKSFVQGLPDNADSHAIVQAILSLARSLRYAVTAEGVETLAQAQSLRDMHCDNLQGYYFSRPVPPDDVLVLLARQWSPELLHLPTAA